MSGARCNGFSDPGKGAPPLQLRRWGTGTWLVDEIAAAGCVPKLVHACKGKLVLGIINKMDTLDAQELDRLQSAGTLPTV